MKLKLSTSAIALMAALAASNASAQDAEYDAQWGLDLINAQAAYDLGFTGEGVVIGELDSGVDVNHPELAGQLTGLSWDTIADGVLTQDYDGHGTHVAGIMVAARNGVGMHGVAYDAGLTVFALNPSTPTTVNETVGLSYALALEQGVRLFNNSWGQDFFIGSPAGQLHFETQMDGQIAAFRAAVALDSIIVVSTGNEYQAQPNVQAGLPFYVPELQANWLAVTAVTITGELPDYANRCGLAAAWCLAAPGGDGDANQINSTLPPGHEDDVDGDGFGPSSGTSMAAPHVTASVAIARQMFPNASGAELTRFVLATATDMGVAGIDAEYGWGLLNLANMAAARSGVGAELFGNAAWAADQGQAVLIEGLDTRLRGRAGNGQGAWGAALGGWSRHDETATANEAKADSVGLVGGYDFVAGEGALFGAALSWVTTDLDEPGLSNSAEVEAIALAVYGAVTRGAVFFEGSAGGDRRDFDFRRGSLAGAAGTVLEAAETTGRAETDGYGLFADGRIGMSFMSGLGEIRPFIHARASHQAFDGFSETGADVFSLTVADTDLTRYEAGPGLEIAFPSRPMGSAVVSGDIAVRYDASWGDEDYEVRSVMLGSGLTSRLGELDDPVTLSGGLSADWGRVQGSLRGFYSRADDQDAGGLSLGMRLTF